MILEGIVTTVEPDGGVNIAPMGPRVGEDFAAGTPRAFTLRPFRTARTYANLKAHGEGVLHVTDDVLLLARAALGPVEPPPPLVPAAQVRGWVLAGACRYHEFRVTACDDRAERADIEVEVVHTGRLRDFFGFNRAKHAVVEAAILATRTALLPAEEIAAEFRRLAVLVEKTGGVQEREAFALLERYVRQAGAVG
jgi:hypothetical protein